MDSKHIQDSDELNQVYKVRKKVFVDELAWVSSKGEYERDNHDPKSFHFGVYKGKEIIAYVRALPPAEFKNFMIFHEFKKLLPKDIFLSLYNWDNFKQAHSIELSRLLVNYESRGSGAIQSLFREVNKWAFPKEYFYWHGVMTNELINLLKKENFVIKTIFISKFSPDSENCTVAYVDLLETKKYLFDKDRDAHDWYFQLGE